jgi:hypothetical protein
MDIKMRKSMARFGEILVSMEDLDFLYQKIVCLPFNIKLIQEITVKIQPECQ